MIDCSIMGRMIDLEDDDLADRDVMISALASAIDAILGELYHRQRYS